MRDLPEWLEEFTDNPEDAELQETYFPKDRNCEVWLRTEMTRAPCRRRNGGAVPRAEKCGGLVAADHKVEGESRNNHRYAVVVQDLVTQWIQSYPCKTKTPQETDMSLRKFIDPSQKLKSYLYGQFIGIWIIL